MDASIKARSLQSAVRVGDPPLIIDVRRKKAFTAAPDMIAGALRRDPDEVGSWMEALPLACKVVVYCVHGHQVSQGVASALRGRAISAQYLEGGLEEGWKTEGGGLFSKPVDGSTRWVTRERPRIDRIACPWLISRFIDRDAEFLYVPSAEVRNIAAARSAEPYDVPDVRFSHQGELCSFDAFLREYRLTDPALLRLATIVRGADTARPELAPQSSGLLAVSLGLSRLFQDDLAMLRHGMVVYDALYRWCKEGQDEARTWNPDALSR
ncbi:MAG: chromate resistance protein [Burkholderiales bacterium]|nr:chromate resistance protein [Burkholderiales bacterium]